MVAIQEYLTTQLGLPYQVILKCTADIGKPNARGVDMELGSQAAGQIPRNTHSRLHNRLSNPTVKNPGSP